MEDDTQQYFRRRCRPYYAEEIVPPGPNPPPVGYCIDCVFSDKDFDEEPCIDCWCICFTTGPSHYKVKGVDGGN